MVAVVFWGSYMMLVLGLSLWVAKHPLSVGGAVLFLYMSGSVVVSFAVSFVVGVFLFLTGVSGMMVAFLYVVALCPNPVFKASGGYVGYSQVFMVLLLVSVVCPVLVSVYSAFAGFSVEMEKAGEVAQWMRDPCMCGGLSDLMPFLGVLLFLCMVSVVVLCGQQKQCLGGHGFGFIKRSYI